MSALVNPIKETTLRPPNRYLPGHRFGGMEFVAWRAPKRHAHGRARRQVLVRCTKCGREYERDLHTLITRPPERCVACFRDGGFSRPPPRAQTAIKRPPISDMIIPPGSAVPAEIALERIRRGWDPMAAMIVPTDRVLCERAGQSGDQGDDLEAA